VGGGLGGGVSVRLTKNTQKALAAVAVTVVW